MSTVSGREQVYVPDIGFSLAFGQFVLELVVAVFERLVAFAKAAGAELSVLVGLVSPVQFLQMLWSASAR